MKRKPWDLCREFGCRRKVWHGKIERNIKLRYCKSHDPFLMSRFAEMRRQKGLETKPVAITKARRNIQFVPLTCCYYPTERVMDKQTGQARVVVIGERCNEIAPRSSKDRNLPKFPNLYGDPCCEKHGHKSIAMKPEFFAPGSIEDVVHAESDESHQRREKYAALDALRKGTSVEEAISNLKAPEVTAVPADFDAVSSFFDGIPEEPTLVVEKPKKLFIPKGTRRNVKCKCGHSEYDHAKTARFCLLDECDCEHFSSKYKKPKPPVKRKPKLKQLLPGQRYHLAGTARPSPAAPGRATNIANRAE